MIESIDESYKNLIEALRNDRGDFIKTNDFYALVDLLDGNTVMADMMWVLWKSAALKAFDSPMPALNRDLSWWKFWQPKLTIRQLLEMPDGKARTWRFLNEASAWL
jgi:hypothetical protein